MASAPCASPSASSASPSSHAVSTRGLRSCARRKKSTARDGSPWAIATRPRLAAEPLKIRGSAVRGQIRLQIHHRLRRAFRSVEIAELEQSVAQMAPGHGLGRIGFDERLREVARLGELVIVQKDERLKAE